MKSVFQKRRCPVLSARNPSPVILKGTLLFRFNNACYIHKAYTPAFCNPVNKEEVNNTSSPEPSQSQTWRGDLTFDQLKARLQPFYLPASFILGTLTIGLKTGFDNFSGDLSGALACAVICGLIVTALVWVVFDYSES
ncbi:hypothetical protein CEUSTIGMA_g7307.t1 [Chlamydomonas eustigma]|uniref:Uncharacterized protein n=1 Tax=Chlamydomonas eustigma TaxID=1157962 RepID=A0A250X9X4_9CHLO|nr:hypothetical protein CEUSTIGMA_g7307.t1 [Chlamydomonas eustigma]|eukprot:GAX79867.1 hypothetical protein CEUSTIGMA_g7307.t1 [Chlamydomonas eustigma]